eukprot:14847906-Alexandrium_andersonii.AAC.1
MHDVSIVVEAERPLMRTPVFSFCDVEYADDTTLLAKTSESMNALIALVEREAGIVWVKPQQGKDQGASSELK